MAAGRSARHRRPPTIAGMTTTTTRQRAALPTPPRRTVLTVAATLSLLTLLVAGLGLLVDGRTITGAPAWLKPAKFGVSIAVYCATLAWFLSMVRGHRIVVGLIAWATALSLVAELVWIGMQAARGTTSHFNDSTPLDSALFSAMGVLIGIVFVGCLAAAVLLCRERTLDRTMGAGIRAGVLVCAAGMAEAGLMIANRSHDPMGAHTVGAPDGGPGLPITGWSTQYGDLRVAHFVGLHALQVLPLLAWALLRYRADLPERTRVNLVRVAGVAVLGLVAILAWQAWRALPLLRPDAVIVGALGVLVAVTAGGVGLALRRPGGPSAPALGSQTAPPSSEPTSSW